VCFLRFSSPTIRDQSMTSDFAGHFPTEAKFTWARCVFAAPVQSSRLGIEAACPMARTHSAVASACLGIGIATRKNRNMKTAVSPNGIQQNK